MKNEFDKWKYFSWPLHFPCSLSAKLHCMVFYRREKYIRQACWETNLHGESQSRDKDTFEVQIMINTYANKFRYNAYNLFFSSGSWIPMITVFFYSDSLTLFLHHHLLISKWALYTQKMLQVGFVNISWPICWQLKHFLGIHPRHQMGLKTIG